MIRSEPDVCECATHGENQTDHAAAEGADPAAITMTVTDMTCGHCAGAVKQAVEAVFSGARVEAIPEARRIMVSGCPDSSRLREVIRKTATRRPRPPLGRYPGFIYTRTVAHRNRRAMLDQ